MRSVAIAAVLIGLSGPVVSISVSRTATIEVEGGLRAEGEALAPVIAAGQRRIEAFFGSPFTSPVVVDIAPDRAGFDLRLAARWKMPPTECWMVAAADATRMPVLAPARWATEACEHDGADTVHVAKLLTHELVHAYHGQHNATSDLSLPDEMGWFVEGLAVYVSGQLDDRRLADPREAVRSGRAPARLADAWSGKYRYGVSGTIVRTAEATAGRAAIARALGATNEQALLAALGTTEARLLAEWRAALRR